MRELRFALRRMLNSPLQLATGLLAFALGIGANVALYSIVDAVLYHPLDLADMDRLVTFESFTQGAPQGTSEMLPADFIEFRARLQSFSSLSMMERWDVTITRDAEPEHLLAARVSADWLETLGWKMIRGRGRTASWRSEKGFGRAAMGRTLKSWDGRSC